MPRSLVSGLMALAACAAVGAASPPAAAPDVHSCFLLVEIGRTGVQRAAADACRERVTPASTFKVPHALAALDAGVVTPDERFAYDGTGQWAESARRDHTLATAIRHSVVWYFQRLATRLGPERESEYLRRFAFGNMDATSALTSFWIGGSLLVTPEEQLEFWLALYQDRLPVAPAAATTVRQMLVQPPGVVVTSHGEQPFAGPWPADAVVSAKPGSATDRTGRGVRWLIGHVRRSAASYVFVSCVIGPPDVEQSAAIVLAARSLRAAHVL